jgi:hypothetical protein
VAEVEISPEVEAEIDRVLGEIFDRDLYVERHYRLLPDGSVSTRNRGITLCCPLCREKSTRLMPIVKIEGIDGLMLFEGCVRCLDRRVQDPFARTLLQIVLAEPWCTGFRA